MKKLTILTLLACIAVISSSGQTQSDTLNIQKAVIAIDGMHKCNEGMEYLNRVSEPSKNNPTYLLTMAKGYDCMSKNAEAIRYYEKFVALDRTNAVANKRLIALKDEDNNSAVVKQQERRIKNFYKGIKQGNNDFALNDNEYCFAIGTDILTGGDKSPYRAGMNLNFISTAPFANNRMVFQLLGSIGFLNGGRKNWFASVLNTTEDDITDVPAAFFGRMNITFAPVIVNNKKLALTVGPDVGFESMILPEVSMKGTFKEYSKKTVYSPIIGLSANCLIGMHFFSSLSYSYFTVSKFENENVAGIPSTETPLNGNTIRLTVGYRGISEMSYFRNDRYRR